MEAISSFVIIFFVFCKNKSKAIRTKDAFHRRLTNYQKFQTWRRKQLWNEKIGKTEEVVPSTLNAVKLTDVPTQMKSTDNRCFSLSQLVRDKSFLIVTPIRRLTIMWNYLGRLRGLGCEEIFASIFFEDLDAECVLSDFFYILAL
jgi:hypothetical protein